VELTVAPRQAETADEVGVRLYYVVKPGETKSVPIQLRKPMQPPLESDREVVPGYITSVTFTDSTGVRWNRVDNGRPIRVFPRRPKWWIRRWWELRRVKRLNPGQDPAQIAPWQ